MLFARKYEEIIADGGYLQLGLTRPPCFIHPWLRLLYPLYSRYEPLQAVALSWGQLTSLPESLKTLFLYKTDPIYPTYCSLNHFRDNIKTYLLYVETFIWACICQEP